VRVVRVGVVGCGSVGARRYIPDLVASPFADVVAVCDVNGARAAQVAAQYGVPHSYTDLDTMLADSDFELLFNLTPMRLHGSLALKALQAGRHVFCEKPLATSLTEADTLLEEAARRGLTLVAAPNAPLSPTFQAAAAAIGSGEIGQIIAARGRYGSDGPHEPWFYQHGGGALFDLGVYNVMTLTGLLGPARAVAALAGVAIPHRTVAGQDVRVEADDSTVLLLDFGNAAYGVIQTGFAYPMYPGHHGIYDERSTIEILGTRGAINWLGYDWAPRGIEIRTQASEAWERRAEDQQGYTWQNGGSYLARCLATGERSLLTAEHAYHTLEVMLGALESARSGKRVEIRSRFPWPLAAGGTRTTADATEERPS
jgi:predicted dehydrogenase